MRTAKHPAEICSVRLRLHLQFLVAVPRDMALHRHLAHIWHLEYVPGMLPALTRGSRTFKACQMLDGTPKKR